MPYEERYESHAGTRRAWLHRIIFGSDTPLGKAVASLIMVLGYGVIAVPTGIVSAEIARVPRSGPVGGQTCAACGSENHVRGARFCGDCGASLED